MPRLRSRSVARTNGCRGALSLARCRSTRIGPKCWSSICIRHGRDREALLNVIEPSGSRDASVPGSALELAGTFVCYSHAWSPYFRGQLIRGELAIDNESSPNRLPVTYT